MTSLLPHLHPFFLHNKLHNNTASDISLCTALKLKQRPHMRPTAQNLLLSSNNFPGNYASVHSSHQAFSASFLNHSLPLLPQNQIQNQMDQVLNYPRAYELQPFLFQALQEAKHVILLP